MSNAAAHALTIARNEARDEALQLRGNAAKWRDEAQRAEEKAAKLESAAVDYEASIVTLGHEVELFKPFWERGPVTRPVDDHGNLKTAATPPN